MGGSSGGSATPSDFLSICLRALRSSETSAAAAPGSSYTSSSAAGGRDRNNAAIATSARWLGLMQLLVNIAAHIDGQRALLHSPSVAGLALELVSSVLEPPTGAPRPLPALAERSLLLLRNLCFSPDAKSHLLAHPRLLPALLSQTERAAEAPRAAAYASSAIRALVYHGEKVKAALRRLPSARERLVVVAATCEFQVTHFFPVVSHFMSMSFICNNV
jgi:rotatin